MKVYIYIYVDIRVCVCVEEEDYESNLSMMTKNIDFQETTIVVFTVITMISVALASY